MLKSLRALFFFFSVLFNYSYVALWKRQDYGDGKKISGCLGLRGRRNE